MLIAVVPLLFVLAGVLMYALCASSKLAEIGRIMFAFAFLVLMWTLASKVLRFG